MSKIFAFAGSNSYTSINHQWLEYLKKHHLTEMQLLNLCQLDIPMYDVDVEKNSGIPEVIQQLFDAIQAADTVLIASAEHNGSYTSYLKATLDWLSRYNRDFIREKNIVITGTSPGRGGASGAIQMTKILLERFGANVNATMSLPSWEYAFEQGRLIPERQLELEAFLNQINN